MVTTTFDLHEDDVLVSYQKDIVFVGMPTYVRRQILAVIRDEVNLPKGERTILEDFTHEVVDAHWSGESTAFEWRLWVVSRSRIDDCADCDESGETHDHENHKGEMAYDFKVQTPWRLWIQNTTF